MSRETAWAIAVGMQVVMFAGAMAYYIYFG